MSTETPHKDFVEPNEIVIREFNNLRGRLCTALESIGLPSRQERAIKMLVKQITYQQESLIKEIVETLDERGAKFSYREGRFDRQ